MAEKKGIFSKIREAFKEPEEDKEEVKKAKEEGEKLAESFASKNFRESQKVELDTSSPVEIKPEEQEHEEQER